MNITLIKKTHKIQVNRKRRSVEEKKKKILKRLQKAIERLQDARKEIHETVQLTIQMKEDGDDIADNVMVGVIEAFTSYDHVPFLRRNIKQNN